MKNCVFCGAQNLDNSKFCCQCGKAVNEETKGRVFIPMGDDSDDPAPRFSSVEQSEPASNNDLSDFALNNNTTKKEEDDAYADFKMRDRNEIFNDEQNDVFDSSSVDRHAERKRQKDAAKSIKRAEKRKKQSDKSHSSGKDPFGDDKWQRNDFWN